jgi:hypothetical protein
MDNPHSRSNYSSSRPALDCHTFMETKIQHVLNEHGGLPIGHDVGLKGYQFGIGNGISQVI